MAISRPEPTHGDKVVLVAISRGFNGKHYDATGELFGWRGWKYLKAVTGGKLSEATIAKSLKRWEALGFLHVEHGRRRGVRRDGNKYFARMPHQDAHTGPWPWPQGANLTGRDLALEEQLMRGQPLIPEASGIEVKEKRVRKRVESLRVESKESQPFEIKGREESRTPERPPEVVEEKQANGSSSIAARLNKMEDAAAVAVGGSVVAGKIYPRVEASPELTRVINGGQRGSPRQDD